MDIHAHGAEPETALIETAIGDQCVAAAAPRERLDFDPVGLTYADFDLILSGWLESRAIVR